MDKREFLEQFVLNRATADRQTDAVFWVEEANKAWSKINEHTRFKEGLGALVRSPSNV